MTTRPEPQVDAVTAPYWEAAAQHRLVLPRCRRCQRTHHHPRGLCPFCWSTSLDWVDAAGTGSVVTFTVVHQPPSPGFATPYVLAVVELSEGPRMMVNILDVDPHEVTIGMAVEVTFEERATTTLPQFRPAARAGRPGAGA